MILKSILISSAFFYHSQHGDSLPAAAPVWMQPVAANIITNAPALKPLVYKIAAADSAPVFIKVLHIGDSHIKAGFFSQQIMQQLNAYYGALYHGNIFFDFMCFSKVGTKYADYAQLPELDEQLQRIMPDWIIVSLGTNDAFSGSADEHFTDHVDRLVSKIHRFCPAATLLITIPADALKYNASRKIYLPLPEVRQVVDMLNDYANTHGIACWDLYHIMGGENSIGKWQKQGLAGHDRVHFSVKGYEVLADWFFNAFVKAIQQDQSAKSRSDDPVSSPIQ